jgi:hypothetical protein
VTAKKTLKGTSSFTRRIKARARVVRRNKGTLTAKEFDEIVISHGGRQPTSAERRQMKRFVKDPYP